jgi:hypothetical protein
MGEASDTALCAWSSNGVHVQGDKASIDAVDAAFHSHGQIDELKRNLRHWREECGKLHAWQRARLEQDDAVRAENDALVKALEEIRDHWANQYDHPRKENEMYRGSYGIGITDGHRACAIIAREALAKVSA